MTTPSEYCDAADLYKNGLQRGTLPNPGRVVANVATGTEIMTLDGHGFGLDDELHFRAEAGGSLPAPLVAGTTYYAGPLTDATFYAAATPGAAAINLTSAGENVVVSTPLPIAQAIQWASALIDEMLPAHVVPLDPAAIPVRVRSATAQLAAVRVMTHTGGAGVEQLATMQAMVQKDIDRWAKGIPLRGVDVPAAANLAIVGTSLADPRGWEPEPGMLP